MLNLLTNAPPRSLQLIEPRQSAIWAVDTLRNISMRVNAEDKLFTCLDNSAINELESSWDALWAWCRAILEAANPLLGDPSSSQLKDLSFADDAFEVVYRIIYSLSREDEVRKVFSLPPTHFKQTIAREPENLFFLVNSLIITGRRHSPVFALGLKAAYEVRRNCEPVNNALAVAFICQDTGLMSQMILGRISDVLDIREPAECDLVHAAALMNIMYITCTAPLKGSEIRTEYLSRHAPLVLLRFMERLFRRRAIVRVVRASNRHSIANFGLSRTLQGAVLEAATALQLFLEQKPDSQCQLIDSGLFQVLLSSLLFFHHPSMLEPAALQRLEACLVQLWKTALANYAWKDIMQSIARSVSRIARRGLEDEIKRLQVTPGPLLDLWEQTKRIQTSTVAIREKWHLKLRSCCGNPGCKRTRSEDDVSGMCLGCKEVYYCSESCQREHWVVEHRLACRLPGNRRYEQQFFEAALEYEVENTSHAGQTSAQTTITVDYRQYPPRLSTVKATTRHSVKAKGILQRGDKIVTCRLR
ncbi:Ankyrin-1 [Paramarasmius palmivorus]|uniref:Ankyrin-1 n=1 Tax=Paramarasmius palmivorus TaxID=297713 RepID=A0AAW0BEF7_9AGAR